MSKANSLDQYYTNNALADKYMQQVLDKYGEDRIYLEPSAGTGAFLNKLQGLQFEAFDIEPKAQGIVKGDFLTQPLGRDDYITVGNPPFILDVEFFNKCAKHSDVIAFIIPRSWRKASIINRLDSNFHLVHDETCPDNSFILDDNEHDVKTCFQIWEKREESREKVEFRGEYFDFVSEDSDWDFIIRSHGSGSGSILDKDHQGTRTSIRFVKTFKDGVEDAISKIDWTERKNNVASVPTINKIEIEQELDKFFK